MIKNRNAVIDPPLLFPAAIRHDQEYTWNVDTVSRVSPGQVSRKFVLFFHDFDRILYKIMKSSEVGSIFVGITFDERIIVFNWMFILRFACGMEGERDTK